MNEEVINAITSEIDNAFSSEKAVDIGMLTIKSAGGLILKPDSLEKVCGYRQSVKRVRQLIMRLMWPVLE